MTLDDALEAALAAVDRGAVSAEDALRSAVAGRSRFGTWVQRNARRWERGPARRPAVRRGGRYPAGLVRAAIAKARRRFAALRGVVSVHWGLVRVHGRSTSHQGVVVTVRSSALAERAFAEVTSLRVRYGKRFRRVRVNVQPVPDAGAPQGARPGRHASVEVGNHRGALGALVERGGELHAILSGHVAQAEGADAVAVAVDGTTVPLGTVRRVVLGPGGDEARAGPVAPSDASRIATDDVAVRQLTSSDVNVAVFIHLARDVEPRKVFVSDVDATAPFDYEDGRRDIPGLIGTSHDVTIDGDSGSPAVDSSGQVVGFVVGSYDGRTYLMPARTAIENLES